MYNLKLSNDKGVVVDEPFDCVYGIEGYLDDNDLPMLCLAAIKELGKCGRVSCVDDGGNDLTIIKITIENEKSLTG